MANGGLIRQSTDFDLCTLWTMEFTHILSSPLSAFFTVLLAIFLFVQPFR